MTDKLLHTNTKYEVIQDKLDVTNTYAIESAVVESFDTYNAAVAYLNKRDYVYNACKRKWYGKSLQYPIVIKKTAVNYDIFDIRTFVK